MGIYLGDKTASVYLGTSTVTVPGAYLGGLQVFPTGPSVPGAPTILGAEYVPQMPGTFAVLSPPASDGGSPITEYVFYVDGVPMFYPASESNGYEVSAEPGVSLQVAAVNAAGEGPKSAAVIVA